MNKQPERPPTDYEHLARQIREIIQFCNALHAQKKQAQALQTIS